MAFRFRRRRCHQSRAENAARQALIAAKLSDIPPEALAAFWMWRISVESSVGLRPPGMRFGRRIMPAPLSWVGLSIALDFHSPACWRFTITGC
jgi:hypothetical protein